MEHATQKSVSQSLELLDGVEPLIALDVADLALVGGGFGTVVFF